MSEQEDKKGKWKAVKVYRLTDEARDILKEIDCKDCEALITDEDGTEMCPAPACIKIYDYDPVTRSYIKKSKTNKEKAIELVSDIEKGLDTLVADFRYTMGFVLEMFEEFPNYFWWEKKKKVECIKDINRKYFVRE